jgi:hypothetical protein
MNHSTVNSVFLSPLSFDFSPGIAGGEIERGTEKSRGKNQIKDNTRNSELAVEYTHDTRII